MSALRKNPINAFHAATRRRLPGTVADLVALVTVAAGINLTLRALIEAARSVAARHA